MMVNKRHFFLKSKRSIFRKNVVTLRRFLDFLKKV